MSDKQKVMTEAIERITREWSEKGMILEGGWQAFEQLIIPKEAGPLQRSEMRKAFFSGAQHLFASIMTMLEPGQEATDKDLNRLTLIHKELENFVEGLGKV